LRLRGPRDAELDPLERHANFFGFDADPDADADDDTTNTPSKTATVLKPTDTFHIGF
jgi:hypothetical protein